MIPSQQIFGTTGDGEFKVIEQKKPYGKVTGTRLAGLLGRSKWDTPFTTTAKLLRLYEDDISAKKEVHAGHVIEPKILDYVGAVHGDELFAAREGNHEDWASDFEDDVFGGHIDGLMPDGAVVEVKTTKNPEDWLNGVPEYYWIQASLYAHFMKTDRIIFLVGFTTPEILADPDSFVPSEKTVARFDVPIIDGFDDMLKKARAIYENTVMKGITTVSDNDSPLDMKVEEILNSQLWTEKQAAIYVDMLRETQLKLDEFKEYEKRAQEIKEFLSMYMTVHDTDVINGTSYVAKRSTTTRSVVDTDAMKKDNIYDRYSKETTYEVIRMSKKR